MSVMANFKNVFPMKFLDGTPVPEDYAKAVFALVREAVESDPGEENEWLLRGKMGFDPKE